MHLARVGDRSEHVEVRARHPGQAEQRQSLRQVEQLEFGLDPLARRGQTLRRAGSADPAPEPSPQFGLPAAGPVLARGPGAQHVRAVDAVVVEQIGDVVNRAEAPGRIVRVATRALQVARQHGQPRLADALVDDLKQRPHRPLGEPRILRRLDVGRGRHRGEDQPARERKLDVRADAVCAAGRRAQPSGESLGEPPLDPASRDGDDLGRERILEWLEQRLGEAVGETVSALGSMDVEHLRELR